MTPWIGGGAHHARRAGECPGKKAITPFVLGKDRDAKTSPMAAARGTFVLMADNSVRFVTEDVSDAVFQGMATVRGPAVDLDKDGKTPLVPAPAQRSRW